MKLQYRRMKRAGKVHWMVVIGLMGVLAIIVLLTMSKENPETVASKFLSALAIGDDEKLTELSYYPNGSKDELKRQWQFATKVAAKNYMFFWKIKFTTVADADTASVALEYTRNSLSPASYGENFQLPMVRDKGRWLVDVRSISREMYPALPR
jgi:hypothetical protein